MRYKSSIITNCTLIFGMSALLFHLMALSYLTALSLSTVVNIPDWGSLLLLNTVGKDSKAHKFLDQRKIHDLWLFFTGNLNP